VEAGSDANNDIQMGILKNQAFVGSYLTAALSALLTMGTYFKAQQNERAVDRRGGDKPSIWAVYPCNIPAP